MAIIKEIKLTNIDLQKLCRKSDITLTQLAREADVSYGHLTRINKGIFGMSLTYWLKLKKILDLHLKNKPSKKIRQSNKTS